ncbi:hypothetical protein [Streptacidiphilus cavernicola]|uniref:Septum formation-related domain-containing protein n=1 Tax=Streptacidiphilus cavernicola TaxID=3342716 RepID=A0ABV6VT32_9ACTN
MSAEEPPATSPRRGPQRRTAVVAAGVLGVLVVVVVLVVALSGGGKHKPPAAAPTTTSAPAPPPPSPTPSADPQTFAYIALHTGDCVSDPSVSTSLKKLVKHDCATPHDAEITGRMQLPDGLTAEPAIVQQAKKLCKTLNDTAWHKQGSRSSSLNEGAYFPDLADYRAGRHTATCMLEIAAGAAKLHAPLTQ